MSTPEKTPAGTAQQNKVRPALLRYRVLAYATGIWLLLLTAEVIAKYIFEVDSLPTWIAVVHGWVYLIYLLATLDLAVKVRWPMMKTVGTALAGTIPFLSFVIEHRNSQRVKRDFAL